MKTRDAISLISKIKESSNRFIVSEMTKHGVQDIATSHGDIIYALYNRPKMTMAEIAKKIGKDKSTVTALVDKLVRMGYVIKERSDEDTRVVHVALTSKGEDLKPVFEKISQNLLNVFYADITETEKEELLRILMKIHSNF
ncbi:MarR family winged helix-turn-helix transcriptional regulator [Paenibacillus xylanilyticus]|uniref:MarR family transcriptional regulator n=1 Tax=Paenibacillus xylanilyticus TaxID=248903 RepID=A0A7Y6C0B5_9BACL|nr:MarR family transcriptional regulator [Paenibacillus xylanilyticus]NUU77791.1 MarR family transcriptional regulator [Paenibacillus xylanilyticus]